MKSRIVTIEPNPFKKLNLKIKQATAKVNSAGQALVDANGKLQTVDTDVPSTVQVPGTTRTLTASITPTGLNTGLSVMVDNPYKDEDVYMQSWAEKILKDKPKAKLQHILEYKHNKPFDHYTNQLFFQIKPSDEYAEMPFFMRAESKLQISGTTYLNLDNPMDEVKYYLAKAHKDVANSYAELKEGATNHLYYIVDNEEVKDYKMDKKRRTNRAVAILEELNEEGEEIMMAMAHAMGNEDNNLTKSKAYVWLDERFREDDTNYTKFIKLYQQYKNASMRDYFFGAAKAQELINKQVVRKRGQKIYWTKPGDETTAPEPFEFATKEKFIKDFLVAPEYQEEVALLDELYEARK